MGFCIVNVNANLSLNPPAITYLSAGPEQTPFCDPYVHLTAVVQTENLAAHQTLWEQLSGTPVTFLGDPANTLEISYAQSVTRDDKVFRFWVNKGTPQEMFSDVEVYGSVLEKVRDYFHGSIEADLLADAPNTVQAANVIVMPAPPATPVGPLGLSQYNSPNALLYWFFTTQNLATLQYVGVWENATGVFSPKAIVYPTQLQVYPSANAAFTYRITSTHKVAGVSQTYIGAPVRLSMGNNLQVVDQAHTLSNGLEVDLTSTRTTRTKVTLDECVDTNSLPLYPSLVGELTSTVTSRTRTVQEVIDPAPANLFASGGLSEVVVTVTTRTRLQQGG